MTVLCIFFVKVKPTYDTQMTIEKRGYIIKFDYKEALLLQKKIRLAVISPADKPPGGHASRRTCLQADMPPGRTLLQEDIPPVVKFFRCLQSDNPPAEGLQEDSSPAQRLQADRPPGGHSSSQKNIQVKAASYTVEIQFDHHNLNSSSHPVPILPLNSGFSSC